MWSVLMNDTDIVIVENEKPSRAVDTSWTTHHKPTGCQGMWTVTLIYKLYRIKLYIEKP